MKLLLTTVLIYCAVFAQSQSLQLHFDPRHSIRPEISQKDFLTLYFEYFKQLDSGKSVVKLGSFLLKTQTDFAGEQSNIGKSYLQVAQEFRFWQPKIFLTLQYGGGLGITTPRQYSYYITNTYEAGPSYHYQIGSVYLSSNLFYKYVPYIKASNDFLYTMYFYKGLWNYKAEFSGDFSTWTENKDHGDDLTKGQNGKRLYFFAEPQLWININSGFAIGTKVNTYFHVNITVNTLELYPTAAIRFKLK